MKIKEMKLNKKNFWVPFVIFSLGSFILLSFIIIIWAGSSFRSVFEYVLWFISERFFILILLLIFVSLPTFFIIRRLLSKNPKKVFYLELPFLTMIYSFIIVIIQFVGFMFAGPMLGNIWQFFIIISPLIIFIILWLSLLTISLYFYYKKHKLFKK